VPAWAWKRMRVETPLYYREKYVSFTLSRPDGVGKALIDWETYRSGPGSILEFIRA
jgi:hypothetical protein